LACVNIRATEVIADLHVQKVAEATVAAPTGLSVDPKTGVLNLVPTLTLAGPPVLGATALQDKIVNYGYVPATLTIPLPTPVVIHTILQMQENTEVKGVLPGDTVEEYPVLEGLAVYGVPVVDPVTGTQTATNIVMKAVYNIRLVVLRAGTLAVQTCEGFTAVMPLNPCPKN